jgi:phosphomannomutase/phosphoglucomutase
MIPSSTRLFGTNGIRGLVNKELTVEQVIKIAYAIGTFFKRGTLIVGHDARTSGPMLTKAVVAGLTSTGCNVLLAGMTPTPTLQYAVKSLNPSGGVIVTASHNPPEYNGIKVIWKDGIEISHEQELQIEDTFFNKRICLAEWNNIGKTQELCGFTDNYVKSIKRQINVKAITDAKYHIAIDPANSVGSLASPCLLQDLGCKITTINGDIDGTFPGRPPEPRPENLGDLSTIVKAVNADLGVAYDGDADRAIFIDENGEIHMGDRTFALVEKYFLKDNPGEKVVTPISSSTMIKDVADEYGGEIVWTKVGSVTVAQTMKRLKAKLGGEENGGIFYGPHQPVRDGAMSTALVLNIMARTGEKLSMLIGKLPRYHLEKGKVECVEEFKGKVLEKLSEQIQGLKINRLDGVKIWFKDKSSILIRPSGTEPIYRLYSEAKTEERAIELIDEYSVTLEKIIKGLH